jgi:hypothetical protein
MALNFVVDALTRLACREPETRRVTRKWKTISNSGQEIAEALVRPPSKSGKMQGKLLPNPPMVCDKLADDKYSILEVLSHRLSLRDAVSLCCSLALWFLITELRRVATCAEAS